MPEQILYKYRSIESWKYLLDIFVNKRLFAAQYQNLNDPMEGVFTYNKDDADRNFIQRMKQYKMELGICSLSRRNNSTLMWSHYADSHKGIVLGVTVKNENNNIVAIEGVRYVKVLSLKGFKGRNPSKEAIKILSKKLYSWEYEKEVRVFSSRSSFVDIDIKEILFGCRTKDPDKNLIKNLVARLGYNDVKFKNMRRKNLDSRL